MEHDKQSHSSELKFDEQQAGFVLGAVVGALVGGAAAMLLSPKNGKEMRALMRQYAKELEKEAYDLAKESRGVAKSFKDVLEEGATEVIEQAPQRMEQAGYQAQQLAEDLNHRIESAKDVVAELAEAFRSGWEEYSDEHPDELAAGTPALIEEEVVGNQSLAKPEEPGHSPTQPLPARRRVHTGSGVSYSMHAAQQSMTEEPEVEPVTATPEPQRDGEVATAAKAEEVKEEAKDDSPAVKRSYTTRVIEEPRPVASRAKAADEASTAAPKKKLLFRRAK